MANTEKTPKTKPTEKEKIDTAKIEKDIKTNEPKKVEEPAKTADTKEQKNTTKEKPHRSRKKIVIISIVCVLLIVATMITTIILVTLKKFNMSAEMYAQFNNHTVMRLVDIPNGFTVVGDTLNPNFNNNATVEIQDNNSGLYGVYSYIKNETIIPAQYQRANLQVVELTDEYGQDVGQTLYKTLSKGSDTNNLMAYYTDNGDKLNIVEYDMEKDRCFSYIKQRDMRVNEKRHGIKVSTKNKFYNERIEIQDMYYVNSYTGDGRYHYETWRLIDSHQNSYLNLYSVCGANRTLIQTLNNNIGNSIETNESNIGVYFLKDGTPVITSRNIAYETSEGYGENITIYDINFKEKGSATITHSSELSKSFRVGNHIYYQYRIPCSDSKFDYAETTGTTTTYYKLKTYKFNLKNGSYKEVDFNYVVTDYYDGFNLETIQIQAQKINKKSLEPASQYIINDRLQIMNIDYEIENIYKLSKDRFLVENANGQYIVDKNYKKICHLGNYQNIFTTSDAIMLQDTTKGYTYVCSLDGVVVKKYFNREIINTHDDKYYMVSTEVTKNDQTYTEYYLERLGVRQSTPIASIPEGSARYTYNGTDYVGFNTDIFKNGASIITRIKENGSTYDYQLYNVDGQLLLELGGFSSTAQKLSLKYSDENHMLLYIASTKGGVGYTILVNR